MKLRIALLCSLAVPSTGQGALWVVDDDPGPGVDFTDVQPAIDGAADGDVILVREGEYGGFSAVGRTLAIVSDGGERPIISIASSILDVPGDGWFVLHGLKIEGASGTSEPGLRLKDCAGPVRIEDCAITNTWFTYVGITNCDAVDLTRCTVDDDRGFPTFVATGMDVTDSVVSVHETVISGSQSDPIALFLNAEAGDGVRLRGASFFYAARSTITGGTGIGAVSHPQFPGVCQSHPTDGGDALVLEDGSPQVILRETALVPGAPGNPIGVSIVPGIGTCFGTPADPGNEVDLLTGSVATAGGLSRVYAASTPVVAGSDAGLSFRGVPGDFAISLATTNPTFLYLAPYAAPLLVDPLAFPAFLGVVPASGLLELTLPVDPLPPGWGSGVLFLQGVAFDAALAGHVGSPAMLVMTSAP